MNTLLKLMAALMAVLTGGAATAQCSATTIHSAMPPRVVGLGQDGISALLGCTPTVLPPAPGAPQSSQIYTWGFVDGALRKQIAVQFDLAGIAASARYQEVPLPAGSSRGDNKELKTAAAIALLAAASAMRNSGGAVCTPATINPTAALRVRPYMTPMAVSGVLGCAPTEIPPTGIGAWIWGVPLLDQVGAKMQVGVVFDELGAVSAHYQAFPPVIPKPAGNGALRVEPPLPPFGNWVPGAMQ